MPSRGTPEYERRPDVFPVIMALFAAFLVGALLGAGVIFHGLVDSCAKSGSYKTGSVTIDCSARR